MRRILFTLAALLFAAPAHADWWEARTDHFVIYSEDNERDTRRFATELERYDNALRSLQTKQFEPITEDWQRVTIFRFGDTDDIGRLAHAPAAGFYRPDLTPVAFTPVRDARRIGSIIRRDERTDLDPMSVLFHEYAHHFMFKYFPAGYPSWYTEAFAETVATIDFHDDGSFHLGNPPNWRSDALFYGLLAVSPKSLLASTSKPDAADFYGYYSVGWLMNHYLTFEPTRQGQLNAYLRMVASGVPSPEAATKAFGDLDKLNDEIGRYKGRGKLYGAEVRPPSTGPFKVELRKLRPDEEAAIKVAMRSKAGVTRSQARGIAGEARDVAAKFPSSVPAQLALAEAEFDAEDYDASAVAADRAIRLDPNSVDALVARGRAVLEKGKKDKALLPQSRQWFAKAHDIDPKHPAPMLYTYLSYYYSGEPIPENALIGLEQAYLAAPHYRELRLVLSRQLLAEKKGPLAREVLLPVALNPHLSKGQKNLNAVIGLIEAKKLDEAYKALAEEMARQEAEAKKRD